MELFEQIRREYEFGTGTIQGVAQKLGVHRRMVREALGSAVQARRKKNRRPHAKLAPAVDFIDAILEADREAPRKQHHTARRIYECIRREVPDCTAAEHAVAEVVEIGALAEGGYLERAEPVLLVGEPGSMYWRQQRSA